MTMQPATPRRLLAAIVSRYPRAPAMVVLVIAVIALNVMTSRTESEVSPIDEREHIDHLMRAARGDLPRHGTVMTQETLRELCTRGSEYIAWPGCTPGRLDPSDYAVGGINVSGDTPFYYLVTAPAARVLRAVTPGWESLVTWSRVLGAAWLLVGSYLTLRAGERLGIPRVQLTLALLLIGAIPIVLTATTTVTSDVTGFAGGAAVLLAALAWERTGRHLWLLGLLAGVAVLFRTTNGVGVLIVLVYLVVRALASARGSGGDDALDWRRYALACVVIVVSVAVGVEGWDRAEQAFPGPERDTLTRAERETRPLLDPLRGPRETDLHVEQLFGGSTLFVLFPPVYDAVTPSRRQPANAPWYQLAVLTAQLLMAGALLLAVFRSSLMSRRVVLGLATAAALIAASPLMVLYYHYANDFLNPAVPRFAISGLPAIALVLAVAARERLGRNVLAVAVGGLYLTALFTLI